MEQKMKLVVNNTEKVKTGECTQCLFSSSSWYVRGKVYPIYKDERGFEYTLGSDGIFDKLGSTVSKFKRLRKK